MRTAAIWLGLALWGVPSWADAVFDDAPQALPLDLAAAQASCPQWQAVTAHWPVPTAGQGRVLLYLWSPRMVLSVQQAAQVQQVAAVQGLRWQAALDPRVPAEEAAAALAAASPAAQAALGTSPPLCDAALLVQGQSLRHFPTAWVWRFTAQAGWQVQGQPIVSAMPPAFWQQALAERLNSAKP